MGELEGNPKRHETEFFYKNDSDCGFEAQHDLIVRLRTAVDKVKKITGENRGTTVVLGHATSGFYFLQIAKGHRRFEDFEPINQMDNAEFTVVQGT